MSEGLFRSIVTQLGETKPSVHLQGWGEPLLHPATISHIHQLKSAGVTVSFTTNGTIMDNLIADSLITSGLDGLTFSMAGGSRTTQEKLRGVGSFELLRRSIQTVVKARAARKTEFPTVAVSYLLTPETAEELPEAISWSRKNGVNSFVTVHLTQAGGRGQRDLQFMMAKNEAQRFHTLRIKAQTRALFGTMRLDLKNFHPTLTAVCDKNPLHSLFINTRGEVSPCVFLCPPIEGEITWYHKGSKHAQKALSFGNIGRSSLAELWESPDYCDFRERFRKRLEFHDRELSKVSFSAAGSFELEAAVKAIEAYFLACPPPIVCRGCAKLDGY